MSRSRFLLPLSVALIVLATLVTVATTLWFRHPLRSLTTPHEEEVDLGAIVTQVRELSRLETAAMHVVQVSTITQSYQFVPNSMAGDELTLFASGDVIAGIDLGAIKDGDVHRDPDGTIVMHLPPPQILVSRIDNKETRVVSRKTGVFRRSDTNLESRAREHAEQAIRTEAVKKGILPMASQNAQTKVAAFLHTLGAKKVRFEVSNARAE